MSTADILRLYHEKFGRLPERPNQLMFFSRHSPHMATLKWIEARSIISNNHWNPRKSIRQNLQNHRKSLRQNLKPPMSSKNNNNCDPNHLVIDPGKLISHAINYNELENSNSRAEQQQFIFTPPVVSPSIDDLSLHKNKHSMHSFPYTRGLLSLQTFEKHCNSPTISASEKFETSITPQHAPSFSFMMNNNHSSDDSNDSNDSNHSHDIDKQCSLSIFGYNDKYINNYKSTTTSSSFDSSGHAQLIQPEPSTHSMTNNNVSNDDDSDILKSQESKTESECPIYDIYECDADEENVFKSLQNKLLFLDDFSRNYLDLRNEYMLRKNSHEKNAQINLNNTKQKISDCFAEIYCLMKQRENTLLFELDEMYNSQSMHNNNIYLNESNDNNQLQKLLHQHMAYISHKIAYHQSISRDTNNILYDYQQRKELILKMNKDTECEHNLRIKYFNSICDELRNKMRLLDSNERHIDFIMNENMHYDVGCIIPNIPKPIIKYIQILGNDILSMSLISYKYNGVGAVAVSGDILHLLSYEISYCYHPIEIDDNTTNMEDNCKQELMHWESIKIDCYQQANIYLIEFEIDDLNLVNVDLMIKMRYLLSNKQGIRIWSVYSDIYQLTQCDLYKSMSNIVPCLDEEEDVSSHISPLFSINPQHSLHDHEDTHTQSHTQSHTQNTLNTVCYHEEYEEYQHYDNIQQCIYDDNDDEDEDDEDKDREIYYIDIIQFKKDLYFDQNELEAEMVQNQQLIQEFMKGIQTANRINNELIQKIKIMHTQKQLWLNNKKDIEASKKKPKLTFLNSMKKRRKSSSASSSSITLDSMGETKTSNMSSLSDTSFNRYFTTSLPGLSHKSPAILDNPSSPSFTEHISNKLNNISHRLSMSLSSSSNNNNNNHDCDECDDIDIDVYGELCHILQENAAYLSRITPLISTKDIPLFCKTIVCDLFGAENDSRSEHLLLRIFECIVEDYCSDSNNCIDIDLFLSDDNIITQMITFFMNNRCDENKNILKQIFQRPIKELIFDNNEKQINLQIDPIQVYKEVMFYEYDIPVTHRKSHKTLLTVTSDSKSDSLNLASLNSDSLNNEISEISENIVASNKSVDKIINKRIEQIQIIVTFLLDRMIENARIISFGIRWICKIISMNTKRIFPNASVFELNALIGKIIYLRYFEPALISPYTFLQIEETETDADIVSNNFEIICEILRSILVNERYENNCNNNKLRHWIKQQQIETIPIFYDKLLDLSSNELSDRLDVDKYLINCKADLQLQCKQIYLLHDELNKNQDIWSQEYSHNIPLFDILDRLKGEAPLNMQHSNKVMNLDLTVIETSFNPFFIDVYNENEDINDMNELSDKQLLQNDESYIYNILFSIKYKDDDIMGIRHSLKELLVNKNLPQHIVFKYRHSLQEFLNELKNWSLKNDDKENILNLINSIVDRINKYILQNGDTYNSFIYGYHNDVKTIVNLGKRLQLKAVTFAKARDTAIDHTNYLENKLLQYQQFNYSLCKIKKKKQCKPIKFTYQNMLNRNVIINTNKNNNIDIIFSFIYQLDSDCFQLKIISKNDNNNSKVLTISLLNLLEMRDSEHTQFVLQSFTFDVDQTIHLLNDILANKI